jgi:hypothetical protein
MRVAASVSAKEQWWAILDPEGSVHQVCIGGGATPAEAGDNPNRWPEHRILAPGCNLHQRYDADGKRWVDNPEAIARAEYKAKLAAMSRAELVEFIIAKIKE